MTILPMTQYGIWCGTCAQSARGRGWRKKFDAQKKLVDNKNRNKIKETFVTRQELENDLAVGSKVKITTKSGFFTGIVEEFGETAVKLTNPNTGKPKRIAYDFIMEYDADFPDIVSIKTDPDTKMVQLPGKKLLVGVTEVTQRLYKKVMGENPSYFQFSNDELSDDERESLESFGGTENNPVECVSWYDAVYFCNKLSMMEGLTPAYSVDGETDPDYWGYTPHSKEKIDSEVDCDFSADGFRLPTNDEWGYAEEGGENYTYAGSDDLDEVGWYDGNSGTTHPVGEKKPNGYGLYDMNGNVQEWTGASVSDSVLRGGSWNLSASNCAVFSWNDVYPSSRQALYGFRVVRSSSKKNPTDF